MDALSTLLHEIRPRGASFEQRTLHAPWPVEMSTDAPLMLVTLLSGHGALRSKEAEGTALGAGDVVLLKGGGFEFAAPGESGGTPAVSLSGTFAVPSTLCFRVLDGLPDVMVVRAASVSQVVEMVSVEMRDRRPGRQAVLDNLLSLLFVTALREWLDRPGSSVPRWYRAQTDPVIGCALARIHEEPEVPWRVEDLARLAGVSRATFARRFSEMVGEPPMVYLACWRTCLAADRLEQSDETLDAIARRVGYADGDALSVAFKRIRGVRPAEHRAAALALAEPALVKTSPA
ncbi:AraC family transcriptional regulator [Actinomadura sp. KC345]|uniref:AraC family transcriptional regulator n=1 Tax=Actinomadura sp. KC345 TaxID=2530371 RepID=UPI0010526E97|nr:AraC family transcriptional regulator [Actinomadura sp. KC345]TDC52500.1 AraC family transcriptional regulator [Actinomadura sp. KC345]